MRTFDHFTNFWLFLRVGEFLLFVLLTSMYMRRCTDKEIIKQIKISQSQLETIKLKLAIDLRNAGIRI